MRRLRMPVDVSRVLDLVVIVLFAPVLALVAAVVALLITADSPGPVIYRCRRVGQHGRPFTMYKFRKMRNEAEGGDLTMVDDDRFTPIGRFLSLSRLDELPQVWNVLKGDMRIVGPRPEVEAFVKLYPEKFEEILQVKPGITGLAQLEYAYEGKMFKDFTEALSLYCLEVLPPKLELDTRYVRTRSSFLDLTILVRTAFLPLQVPRATVREHAEARHLMRVVLPTAACTLTALALVAVFAVSAGPIP
jgi:lipopolysaccharide/colanic/teichoic acid biosynthesis glycosyltransferase